MKVMDMPKLLVNLFHVVNGTMVNVGLPLDKILVQTIHTLLQHCILQQQTQLQVLNTVLVYYFQIVIPFHNNIPLEILVQMPSMTAFGGPSSSFVQKATN